MSNVEHQTTRATADVEATPKPPWPQRVIRKTWRALAALVAAYLLLRAAVEPFTINPFRPETYQHNWGGPHLFGVLLVHCGPGLIIAVMVIRRLARARPSP